MDAIATSSQYGELVTFWEVQVAPKSVEMYTSLRTSQPTVTAIREPSELTSTPENIRFLNPESALFVPSLHVAPESVEENTPLPVLDRRIFVQVKSHAAPLKSFVPQFNAPKLIGVRDPPRDPIRGVPP